MPESPPPPPDKASKKSAPPSSDEQTRKRPPQPAPDTLTNQQTGAWAMANNSSPSAPRSHIGRFEVQSLLGEGAFAFVYLATDPELEREVAIKVPKAELLTPEARELFLRENRLAAIIHHPNICPVYEVGTEGQLPYIVMRMVRGTLAGVLKRMAAPLPPRTAVAIVRKLALGLVAAHAQNVIHRDLKPANVLFDEASREVLIADFGLARFADQASEASNGVPKGTPAYMSPEQARGRASEVGPQSDIYSLGVMLYEMLTGKVPFTGSVIEVMVQHWETAPRPPSSVRPDLDPKLDAICLKAMAKKPTDRYPSAKAFAAALGEYMRTTDTGSERDIPTVQEILELDPEPPAKGIAPTKPGAGKIRPVSPPVPKASLAKPGTLKRAPADDEFEPRRRSRAPLWFALAALLFGAGVAVGVLAQRLWATTGSPVDPAPAPAPAPANNPFDQTVERNAANKLLELNKLLPAAKSGRPDPVQVSIQSEGKTDVSISTTAEIPLEPAAFTISSVKLLSVSRNIDAELRAHLVGLSGPVKLWFERVSFLSDETLAVIAHIPQLEELVLIDTPRVTSAGLAKLNKHPGLKRLTLVHLNVPSEKLESLLPTLTALTALSLDCGFVTDGVFAALKELPNLTTVDANYPASSPPVPHRSGRLTKAGIGSLSGVKKLSALNLAYHPVEDDWLPYLFALPLQSLDLTGTNVTVAGAAACKKALPKCKLVGP